MNQTQPESIFQKNYDAILTLDPLTAIALKAVTPNTRFETYVTSDPANINFVNKETFKPIFISNPVSETMKRLHELDNHRLQPHLYFFGAGNGVLYKLLLNEFEKLEHLVVIEPEVEILFNVLNMIDFSEAIKTRRIEFHVSKNICKLIGEYIFGFRTSTLYCKLYDLHLFNSYYGSYADEYLRVNKIFTEVIESIVISLGNDSNDSVLGIKQHLLNTPEMLGSPSYANFIKHVRNSDTVIIVSTGPSLHKQLPTLKEIAPYATLFCIDASFPILAKAGIKPDVVFTLERVKESAKFYTDTSKEAQKDVIFAVTSIAHHKTLDAITRGQKVLPMRPFPYTFYFDLSEFGYTGIGMSAANMAYETARHAGFHNIVLIGQDLAFGKDGTSHSKGAVYGENEITKDTMATDDAPIMLEAYGGKGEVKSTYVWRLFLKFFEVEIAKTPPSIKVINATEGGARIHGADEYPFKEVLASINKSQIKSQIKLNIPTQKEYNKNLNKVKRKVEQILLHGYKQKAKIENVFLEICAMTEELERLNKAQQLEKIDFKRLSKLVTKINTVKDNYITNKYTRIFDNIVQSYIMHQEMELAKISTRVIRTDIEHKARQIDWIYAHRYWFFSLAGGIHTVLEIVKESVKDWMEIPAKYQQIPENEPSTKAPAQEAPKAKDPTQGMLKL